MRLHKLGLLLFLTTAVAVPVTASAQGRGNQPVARRGVIIGERDARDLRASNFGIVARNTGYRDGYQEGLNDGRSRHRNNPSAESRYRNGDHGYERWFGDRDRYRASYRGGFWDGYERGYRDGARR